MARFDLNLLSALNALLSEKNVTRAAEKLNVTQPTMSGMLQRLRFQFDDQLLLKEGRQMELTPFGASLVEPVREALHSVEQLVHTEPVFDPATSTREIKVMATDYITSIFLPPVVAHLAVHAPGVRLVMKPVNAPTDRLFSGDVDLCVTADDLSTIGWDNGGEKLQSEYLFSDEFVCIVAKDHPLDEHAGLEDLLAYPHVGVEIAGTVNTIEIAVLRQLAPQYRPNYVVADFSLIAPMVAYSNLVGVIQSQLAVVAARTLPVRVFPPPFQMPALNECMLWHSRHTQDPAHAWFRSVLRTIASDWSGDRPSHSMWSGQEARPGKKAILEAVS